MDEVSVPDEGLHVDALEGEAAHEYADKGKYADDYILKEYKKIVRSVYGVAFPHVFSVIYKEAKQVRQASAHD